MLPVIAALFACVVALFQSRWVMQLKMLARQHQLCARPGSTVRTPRPLPIPSRPLGMLIPAAVSSPVRALVLMKV